MLHYLLDAHISNDLVKLVSSHRPDARIVSVVDWHAGAYLNDPDELILVQAHREKLTLVTFDLATIPPLLTRFADSGIDHAGVIFADHRTVAQHDIGSLNRALIAHWDRCHTWDWTNRIDYLQRPG